MANTVIKAYWKHHVEKCVQALAANDFEVYLADDCLHAQRIVIDEIIPDTGARTVAWSGSKTMAAMGLVDLFEDGGAVEVLGTSARNAPVAEKTAARRDALFVDCYFSGTNAMTEDGKLVNCDVWGSRIAAMTFGPKYVVVLAGRNKIVPDLEAAMVRAREYAAPVYANRPGESAADRERSRPCIGECDDCTCEYRTCNTWAITEKAFPARRTKIVLINEDLGF